MTGPEGLSGAEFATQQQLERLFDSASVWLEMNRPLQCPDDLVVLGEINSEPITAAEPFYDITVPGDRIRSLLPEASGAMDIGVRLKIEFTIARWERNKPGGAFDRLPALCGFIIDKTESSSVERETITLVRHEDEELGNDYETLRHRQYRPGSAEDQLQNSATPKELLLGAIAASEVERRIGADMLTSGECEALQSVIDHLGSLAED